MVVKGNDREHEELTFERRNLDREYVRRVELDAIITKTVKEVLTTNKHECVLDLNKEQLRQVGNLFSAIEEIGQGNLSVGVERIRENHKLITRYCTVTGKIGTTVITALVVLVLSFIGSSFVIGLVEKTKAAIK